MWERPVNRKIVAGVASGISEGIGVAQIWVRIAFIVLAFTAGIGFILYGIGWLVMPRQGRDESIVDRIVDRANEPKEWVSIGLVALGVLLLAGNLDLISNDIILAGGLIAIGLVLYTTNAQDDGNEDPSPSGGSPPEVTTSPDSGEDSGDESESLNDDAPVTAGASSFVASDGGSAFAAKAEHSQDRAGTEFVDQPTRQRSVRTQRTRRRRSVLPRLTFGILLLVVGSLGMYHASVGFVKDVDYVAAALGIVGAGVLVSSVWGRARWLVPLGIVLMPILVLVNFMQVSVIGPWGEYFEEIETFNNLQESYKYGGGDVTFRLDERAWDEDVGSVSVDVEIGVGSVTLVVPDDVNVVVRADIGLGSVENAAIPPEGFDPSNTASRIGRDWRLHSPVIVTGDEIVFRQVGNPGPTVEFDIAMGLGTVSLVEAEVGE
jgi:phage shock protein PspC (stress-responsive transcriptional regulator)